MRAKFIKEELETPDIYELVKMVQDKVYSQPYCTSINTNVWDENGKIVPYKKNFSNRV